MILVVPRSNSSRRSKICRDEASKVTLEDEKAGVKLSGLASEQ